MHQESKIYEKNIVNINSMHVGINTNLDWKRMSLILHVS